MKDFNVPSGSGSEASAPAPNVQTPHDAPFQIQETVIYGALGRYTIVGLEYKHVGSYSQPFYKIERQRPIKSAKKEPCIWVPVYSSVQQGMRRPLSKEKCTEIWKILESREYFVSIQQTAQQIQSQLENLIRTEGVIGLAKAVSALHVYKKKTVVPSTPLLRFFDQLYKMLTREILDVTEGLNPAQLEEKLQKAMKPKLAADN